MDGDLHHDLLRLGEAAKAAGITPAQLEYYLAADVVRPTRKSGGQQRLFDARAVKRIQMVRLLNTGGYTLRDIREIFMEGNR